MPFTPKSFVYQETENNFTDTRQQIAGQQIVSLKKFRGPAPAPTEAPDYQGQIGIGNKADGSALVYISNIGPQSTNGWDLVSTGVLTDEYANKDKANNFANTNQTILNQQIPYIEQGFVTVDQVPIKGQGHIYVDMSVTTEPKVYMAIVSIGGGFEWTSITDHTKIDNVVMKNTQNNFKDGRQTILNQSIATINPSLKRPAQPVRSGEIYIQKANPQTGEKAKMWVASSNAIGGFDWAPMSYTLDEDLVYRNVPNNFTDLGQKIMGKQILTFATRGDQSPAGYKPDYDGQFYIAFRTLQSGARDAAVWVANSNTWVPLTSNLDPEKVVMTDKENVFTKAKQAIKNGDDLSQITGARIKLGNQSPIADSTYKATMLGEICIYKNDSTQPSQISIWTAISINASPTSNAGEWVMIWSSVFDQTTLARTDKSNTFTQQQKILGFGNQPYDVMKARIVVDENSPVGRIIPSSIGETFMTYREPVPGETGNDPYEVFVSTGTGNSNQWLKVYDKPLDKVVRTNEKTFFTERVYIGPISDSKKMLVNGCREATGTVYNTTMPRQIGETVMCTETISGEEWIVIYMCAMDQESVPEGHKSRKNWIEIGRRKKKELVHI